MASIATTAPTFTRTRRSQVATTLALAAGSVLLVKGLAVAVTDGAVPAAVQGPAYLVGVVLTLAASVALGATQQRWSRRVLTAAAAIGSLMWLMAVGEVLESAIALLTDLRPTQEEAPVVALGLVWLAVGLHLRR